MAERAPKLPWRCIPGVYGLPDYWYAIVGPLDLSVRVPLRADNEHCWFVKREPNEGHPMRGIVDSLLAAQLAAEDAASAWLREGVEALGGRVLTAEQVALCVEALQAHAEEWRHTHSDEWAESLHALAKELGDG